MSRYQGNIVIKNPATPTGPSAYGSAPGMWKLNEVAYWIKQGVWPNPAITPDQYFPYVSLLLSTTSLGNANNNLFVDSSGAFNPISRNGNTTQGSFTPYGSNWSNYFDGSGDYLTVASNAAFGMGTGDFTIECWVNPSAFTGSGNVLVDMRSGTEPSVRPDLEYNSSGTLNYRVNGSTVISGGTLVVGTWFHVAICRSGTTTKMFLNGTQVGSSYTDSNNYGSSAACRIGADDDGSPNAYVNGFMSNVRVVKGTAVYTSNFTVPTSPLTAISGTSLLTCQSNRFRDASSNAFTITVNGNTSVTEFAPFSPAYPGITYNQSDIQYWSGYFDGSGDYLTVPDNAALDFGTSDFTLECWVYANSLSNIPFVMHKSTGNGTGTGWFIEIGSGNVYVGPGTTGGTFATFSASAVVTNTWFHLAVTRVGTALTCYVNGTSVGTQTAAGYASSYDNSAVFGIGGWNPVVASYDLNGYISNVRVVKGTAVYTGNFTPSTTPLTAITNTSLLTCQSAAFTDNSTNNFLITLYGNTTVTGNNPFQTGSYSNYFDGSGDYFTVPYTTANFDWWTSGSDFTIEYWFYANSLTGISYSDASINHSTAVGNRSATSTTDYWSFGPTGAGTVTFYYYNGGGNAVTSTATFTTNSWNHVAMTKTSSGITVFVNGVAGTTTAISGTPQSSTGVSLTVGQGNNSSFNGNISNLRIVRGTAIYSGNFTVPTTPLTAVTNTKLLTCQSSRFIDSSTNALTLTVTGNTAVQSFNPFYTSTIAINGGSMYFDGSGDYLSVPSSPGLNFGTGNWTIECWVYVSTRTANYPLIFGNNRGSFTTDALAITNSNADSGSYNDKFVVAWGSGGWSSPSAGNSNLLVANVTNNKGTWYHFALVRESSTSVKMYRDGVQVANATVSSSATFNWGYSGSFMGGGNWDGAASYFNGYISGLRVSSGALYTTTFTPPTAPQTPTAATTLLVNGMNAGAYDATAINDMETVGNAGVSTAVSKFGTSSMAFDGTGDYAVSRGNTILLGSGAFTVEFWVYFNAVNNSTVKYLYDFRTASATSASFLAQEASNAWTYYNGAGSAVTTGLSGSTFATGQWYHVAITRSSNVLYCFVNGTKVSSDPADSSNYASATLTLGARYSGSDGLNGYIDDVRLTAGVARYTANFTPPTQAFPTY